MKLLLLLLAAEAAFAAEWEVVERISSNQKIEVAMRDGTGAEGTFLSATNGMLLIRDGSAERSFPRLDIGRVRVFDPSRRWRKGLLWIAIGAGSGAAAGAAACPGCPNEGAGYKYVGPGVAIGAGIGALGFLASPYRTVYKSK